MMVLNNGGKDMDKALFREKVGSMLPDLTEAIKKECDKLYDCGGVDTDHYGDDFELPKIALTVAIGNQARQYSPLTRRGKAEVSNLRHF